MDYRKELIKLLGEDLDFHNEKSSYASHNFHSFPAKFPPQLPRKFILGLTMPGEIVLDPMLGSGTTLLESHLNNRTGIGFDIDPLAVMISKIKVSTLEPQEVRTLADDIIYSAGNLISNGKYELEYALLNRWDIETQKFIDYWFQRDTQLELMALISQIEKIENHLYREFFTIAFSSVIITKSGGVSLAIDLAHTRPHRAKVVISRTGNIIVGEELFNNGDENPRLKFITKRLRSTLDEFYKRLLINIKGLSHKNEECCPSNVLLANAQNMPLPESRVDLIVTSPPYAANAIDYMRAHKFSLAWMGYSINVLGKKRKDYFGGEATSEYDFQPLPVETMKIVKKLSQVDEKRGLVLQRYFSEMKKTLKETHRVLKPGRVAVFVVGNSNMRGINTKTHKCLAEIGKLEGFEVAGIGVRHLDRNRRMLPMAIKRDSKSQIQQRMQEEYVIGFYKPNTKLNGRKNEFS